MIWEAVRIRHTPPSPLERGDWNAAFLLVMKGLCGVVSPLERGNEVFVFYFEPVF